MTINPAAIIAEYNPFHSGHAYHIKKTRELGYTHILCIMSSEFVQRGETAVLDSHFRARRAIMGGADLVIELMPPYCIGSAKDFASAGVNLIKGLGIVNALSFGAECSDIKILAECQDRLSNIKSDDVRKLMRSGMSYPQAVAKLSSGYSDILSGANNTCHRIYPCSERQQHQSGLHKKSLQTRFRFSERRLRVGILPKRAS